MSKEKGSNSSERIDTARSFAKETRKLALEMVHRANASHIGGSLSAADLMAYLYSHWLKKDPQQPNWSERDRFILSKGHAAAIHYATLAQAGYFPKDWLETYCQNQSKLPGHSTHSQCPGIEISTGSLGHGLPVALGMALAAKRDKKDFRAVVLLSDGELNEGSNWEGFLFAPQHNLDNLLVIVDYNRIQSFGSTDEVIALDPLAQKFEAANWAVREIDGHSIEEIDQTLSRFPFERDKPSMLIANTVKGKGVSYMEGELLYHYRPPDEELLAQALEEVEEA